MPLLQYFDEPIDQKSCKNKLDLCLQFYKDSNAQNKYCSGVCLIFDDDNLINKSIDKEYIIGHAVSTSITSVSQSKRGYLCTGYVAYLYSEPCFSCAMALVHGRIKKVFVYKKCENGIFSESRFNYNQNLNHRYNVYFNQE